LPLCARYTIAAAADAADVTNASIAFFLFHQECQNSVVNEHSVVTGELAMQKEEHVSSSL
jgi:hypothetical protein